MDRPIKAKRKLSNFDFTKEGCHVALVDKAANGHTVLITKASDEIILSLSMENFLSLFFGMWECDAAALALIMGYKSEVYEDALVTRERWGDDWYADNIEETLEKVYLIKAAASGDIKLHNLNTDAMSELVQTQKHFEDSIKKQVLMLKHEDFVYKLKNNGFNGLDKLVTNFVSKSKEGSFNFIKNTKTDFDNLTEEQYIIFKMFQLQVEKNLLTGDVDSKQEDNTPVNGEIHNSTQDKIPKGEKMSDVENAALVELKKSLDAQAEILKSIQAENAVLKAEKEAKYEAELIEKAKGFEFVAEDKAEAVGKLFKSLDIENLGTLLEVFKSAQDVIADKKTEAQEADMFVQKSASGEGKDTSSAEDRVALVNKALGIKAKAE